MFGSYEEVRLILAEIEEDPYSDRDAAAFLRCILEPEEVKECASDSQREE